MKKQSVYTRCVEQDAGAFCEDAISLADAISSMKLSKIPESTATEIVEELIDSMKRLSTDDERRAVVAKLLV